MLVNGDPATGERRPQLATLELPDLVGEADRVVAADDSLVLDGKDQVEISAPQRHKGSSALTGGNAEALIELFDVLIAQKAVGFLQNGDASRSQSGHHRAGRFFLH